MNIWEARRKSRPSCSIWFRLSKKPERDIIAFWLAAQDNHHVLYYGQLPASRNLPSLRPIHNLISSARFHRRDCQGGCVGQQVGLSLQGDHATRRVLSDDIIHGSLLDHSASFRMGQGVSNFTTFRPLAIFRDGYFELSLRSLSSSSTKRYVVLDFRLPRRCIQITRIIIVDRSPRVTNKVEFRLSRRPTDSSIAPPMRNIRHAEAIRTCGRIDVLANHRSWAQVSWKCDSLKHSIWILRLALTWSLC